MIDLRTAPKKGGLLPTPLVLILLGPPGSGKGTHALPLSERLSIPHLSTGELFRAHIRNRTELGKKAEGFIQKGNLVPDELVIAMVEERISRPDCEKGYLLDGFPRTLPQAEKFHPLLKGGTSVAILHFDLSDSIVLDRITGRLACSGCSKTYHRLYDPPQELQSCDGCRSPL